MGTKAACPKCKAPIPLDDINIATDLALCRICGNTWKYSDLVENSDVDLIDVSRPPRGAWFREIYGRGFEVGASTRSYQAIFLVPFMCVWSGGSLGGIYGSQIAKGQFNPLLCLFGLPFLIGTIFLGSITAMSFCGKVTVTVDGDNGTVFTGVGRIGRRKKFNWRQITGIKRTEPSTNRDTSAAISLTGERVIQFGSMANADRQRFIYAILRRKLRESGR